MLSPRSTLLVLCILNSGCAVFGFLDAWTYPFYADSKTYFYMYMPSCPAAPYILTNQNASKIKSFPELDLSIPMKVLIHGYWRNFTSGNHLREKYLMCKKYNVVDVHWAAGANTDIYWLAQINSYFAGQALARFLTILQTEGVQMNKVGITAHGLACSVASVAAKQIGNLSTIVAIDASSNLIAGTVNPDSAQYVQAIHTETLFWGTIRTVGHADFYINGGEYQPGCSIFRPSCSHEYSGILFIASLPKSPYSGCRRGSNGDCGYVLGGDPLQVYSGVFDVSTRKGYSANNATIWNLYNLL